MESIYSQVIELWWNLGYSLSLNVNVCFPRFIHDVSFNVVMFEVDLIYYLHSSYVGQWSAICDSMCDVSWISQVTNHSKFFKAYQDISWSLKVNFVYVTQLFEYVYHSNWSSKKFPLLCHQSCHLRHFHY